MLVGVTLLGVAFVAISLWFWLRGLLRPKPWLGAFVLVAWVVAVGVKVHFDQVGESRLSALPSIAWPTMGTAEKGARLLEAAVAEIAGYVRDLRGRPLPQRQEPVG